jgi:hypothetical protein
MVVSLETDGTNAKVDIIRTGFDLIGLNWLQIGFIVSKDVGDNDGSFSCITTGSRVFIYIFISGFMENG